MAHTPHKESFPHLGTAYAWLYEPLNTCIYALNSEKFPLVKAGEL